MKKFIQDLLINYALAVIGIYIINSLATGIWATTLYLCELFFVILMVRLLMFFTNRFRSRYPVLEYLLEMGMILAVVLGFGWLFKWYDFSYLWLMIATIVTIYIAVYAVGIGRTKRDVAFINEQIRLRQARIRKLVDKKDEEI